MERAKVSDVKSVLGQNRFFFRSKNFHIACERTKSHVFYKKDVFQNNTEPNSVFRQVSKAAAVHTSTELGSQCSFH